MARYNHVNSGWCAALVGTILLGLLAADLFGNAPGANAQNGDPATVIATVPLIAPRMIALNHQTNRIYIVDFVGAAAALKVFDGATHALLATVPVANNVRGLAVNTGTNRIYLSFNDGYHGRYSAGSITVLDGTSHTVVAVIPVTSPTELATNPQTNRVYVIDGPLNSANPTTTAPQVLVYDGGSHTLVATIPLAVGGDLHQVAVNATTTGGG